MTTQKSTLQRPPKEMLKNVSTGTALQERWGRGGYDAVAAGIGKTGESLSKGEPLSLDAIKELSKFFGEHPSINTGDVEKDGGPTADVINYMMCGGAAGRDWTGKVIEKNTDADDFTYSTSITKVDESLGLVLGWAIICQKDGEDYYDLQKDHIPADAMLKASVDFMQGARVVGDMHDSVEGGQVVFAWPMTKEIAEAFGIVTKTTGLMIAIKPADQKTLEKFKNGTYNGFSIGGQRIKDEEVA